MAGVERAYTLDDPFEYQGYWWSPEEPQERLPGTLRFDPEGGASLNLFGTLKSPDDSEGIPILGLSTDNTPITLTNLIWSPSIPGLPPDMRKSGTSTTTAGTVVVGRHFEREEDVGFERLIIRYLHLDAWANVPSGFEIEIIDTDDHPKTVKHKIPETVTASVGEEFEVRLFFGQTLEYSARPVTWVTVTQPAEIAIRFGQKQSLGDLTNIAFRLQHLLSLGMRRSSYPVAMWGETELEGEARRVGIHYQPLGRIADVERPSLSKMLFALRDLPEGFGPTVETWLQRAEELDPVYRLLLGTVYNPSSFIEQQFLSLVTALEVYYRRVLYVPDPPEEHEKRKREILEAVPAKHKSWLEWKLQAVNEPSLNQKLHALFRSHLDVMQIIVGESGKVRADFIDKVVDARNYRAHFPSRLEGKATQGSKLYPINQTLTKLLEACLMREIGFTDEEITKAVMSLR